MSPIPTQNPVDEELKRSHAALSPEAQQAVSLAIGGNIPAPAPPEGTPRQASRPFTIPIPQHAAAAEPSAPGIIPIPKSQPVFPQSGPGVIQIPGSQLPEPNVRSSGRIPIPEPPGMAPAKAELQRLTVGPQAASGIDQIKHAGIRIPLQILDAIGGGLLPGISQYIPGTQLRHERKVAEATGAEQALESEANEAVKRAAQEATTGHTQAETEALPVETALKNAQAEDLRNGKKFSTVGGGIYDLQNHKWEVEPSEKDKDQLLEVSPEKGKLLGLTPDKEGKYYIPPQAAGELLKPIPPKEPKEGELPLGERVPQINQAMTARYQVLHPGQQLPVHYLLPANATQKDFDRTDKLLEGEEKAFGTKDNHDQTAELRKQTMALARQNREQKTDTALRQSAYKVYTPAMDSAERFNVMAKNYEDATKNHDQQAMLSLLANHLGMTMGLQKGARLTKDIIAEAKESRPWLQGLTAKFDKNGYLSGVTLTPEQMAQMVNLGRERFAEDITKAHNEARYLGVNDEGPKRTPNEATISHYVRLSGGNAAKAKELAAKDGWSIE